MDSSIILIVIIIFSAVLFLKIVKSPEFRQSTEESQKVFIRLTIGGLVGAVLLLSLFWLYLIVVGKPPHKLNPYVEMTPYIVSPLVAVVGFWVGATASLMIGRRKK